MSENNSEGKELESHEALDRPRRIPIWLVVVWVLGILAATTLHLFADALNDSLAQQDAGVIFFITVGIWVLCCACLFTWLIFFSRWNFWISRVLPLSVVMLIAIFLILYKPRHGGNAEIVGWEPRFWRSELEMVEGSESADLSVSGPNDFWQFLGPHRNATLTGTAILADETPHVVWKQPIGKGWSGFAAVGEYAVTMEQRGGDELVNCYRIADGTLAWTYRHEARYQDPTNLGGLGPRGTPAIVDGRVYASGGTGILVCLNGQDGRLLWDVDVPELLGIKQNFSTTMTGLRYSQEDSKLPWGRAASPLVHEDLVIVPGGGPRNGPFVSLIAFDRITGVERWRGGEQMISYGSASVARINGQDQIIILNESSVAGHDPISGDELWRHERAGNSDTDANCSQPIAVADDLILIGKGYGLGGELLRVQGNDVVSVWKNSLVVKTKLTVPVVFQDHIYCLSDGILECTELMTGKRIWKRTRFSQGQLLLVGDKLLVHSQSGTLHLVQASPVNYQEFENFRIDTISGVCWNMLCLHNRSQLLVRSELEAALIQIPVLDEKIAGNSDYIFLSGDDLAER